MLGRLNTRSLCQLNVLFLGAIMLCCQLGTTDFSHIKHKIKLKKIAKLAFAAKLLAPKFILLPIPLPIIKRQKHQQQRSKVVKLEDDPWKKGWNLSGGRADNGSGVEGGGGAEWHTGNAGIRWQEGTQTSWGQAGFNGWDQGGLDGHLEYVKIQEQKVALHRGHQHGHGAQRVTIKEIKHTAGPWMRSGNMTSNQQSQNSHQIEAQEEILPALKAAWFIEGANGELSKMVNQKGLAGDGWESYQRGWSPPSNGAHSDIGTKMRRWHSLTKQGWFEPAQTAEVLEAKEIVQAKIVDEPFEVEAQLSVFDVSDTPVQAVHAPPVKALTHMDPWPSNVAAPNSNGYTGNQMRTPKHNDSTGDSHFRAAVGHLNSKYSHIQALRDQFCIEAPHLYHSHETDHDLAQPNELAYHTHKFHDSIRKNLFLDDMQQQYIDGSHLRADVGQGISHPGLRPLPHARTIRHETTVETKEWRP